MTTFKFTLLPLFLCSHLTHNPNKVKNEHLIHLAVRGGLGPLGYSLCQPVH